MRVSFSQSYGNMTLDVDRTRKGLDLYTDMVSSGQKLQKPAEDPQTWAQAVNLRQGLREIESFQKNVDFASGWNRATESVLTHVRDLVVNAKKLGLQATNVQSPDMQQALTDTLNGMIKEAVYLATTRYGDRYLFSSPQSSTAPFQMTVDASGDVTAISAYQTPAGNQDLDVLVSKGSVATVNIDGQTAFATAGTDVLQQLLALKTAVRSGDLTGAQQQLTALDNSLQNLDRLAALTGQRQVNLDHRQNLLSSLKKDDQTQLSGLTDADMASAITQLQKSQTVHEAALRAAAALANLNPTQFL
jgi:flagellar hook-associated protein 3 FlgL